MSNISPIAAKVSFLNAQKRRIWTKLFVNAFLSTNKHYGMVKTPNMDETICKRIFVNRTAWLLHWFGSLIPKMPLAPTIDGSFTHNVPGRGECMTHENDTENNTDIPQPTFTPLRGIQPRANSHGVSDFSPPHIQNQRRDDDWDTDIPQPSFTPLRSIQPRANSHSVPDFTPLNNNHDMIENDEGSRGRSVEYNTKMKKLSKMLHCRDGTINFTGICDALAKSISGLDSRDKKKEALETLFAAIFRRPKELYKLTGEALFCGWYQVKDLVVGEQKDIITEKRNATTNFIMCAAIRAGTSTSMLAALRKLTAQVLPTILPTVKSLRQFNDKYRINFMRDWELKNTATGMRVNLVTVVRF